MAGAHDVAPGETLASIAGAYGLDPWALATFNGLTDIDTLHTGQRLRIPLTDVAVDPAATEMIAFGSNRAGRRARGNMGGRGYLGRRDPMAW